MTKKLTAWVVAVITLLLLASCSTPCNCGYTQAEPQTNIESMA